MIHQLDLFIPWKAWGIKSIWNNYVVIAVIIPNAPAQFIKLREYKHALYKTLYNTFNYVQQQI